MRQCQLCPLPPTSPPTTAMEAAAAASFISSTAHNYPPPQFYFGWGPPHYVQQGWWPSSHLTPPMSPSIGYSSSAAARSNTFDSSNASVAATASISLPLQQQRINVDYWLLSDAGSASPTCGRQFTKWKAGLMNLNRASMTSKPRWEQIQHRQRQTLRKPSPSLQNESSL